MSKMVAYFSYSGVTKRKAEALAKKNGADTFEIKAKVPDLAGVDEIWIGYPIWWYTHPRIINTFSDQADLKGKTIHLFATSSSTGIEGSVKELKETYPDADIADGKRI